MLKGHCQVLQSEIYGLMRANTAFRSASIWGPLCLFLIGKAWTQRGWAVLALGSWHTWMVPLPEKSLRIPSKSRLGRGTLLLAPTSGKLCESQYLHNMCFILVSKCPDAKAQDIPAQGWEEKVSNQRNKMGSHLCELKPHTHGQDVRTEIYEQVRRVVLRQEAWKLHLESLCTFI